MIKSARSCIPLFIFACINHFTWNWNWQLRCDLYTRVRTTHYLWVVMQRPFLFSDSYILSKIKRVNLYFGNTFAVSSLGSSSGEVRSYNIPASSLQESRTKGKQFPEDTLVKCSDSQRDGPRFSSKFLDNPVIEVESVIREGSLDCGSNRYVLDGHCSWMCKTFYFSLSKYFFYEFNVGMGNKKKVTPWRYQNLHHRSHLLLTAIVLL